MKIRVWREFRDIRAIQTGDGIVEIRKGDVVMVAVVERWDDASEAIAAMQRLTAKPPIVEEP